MTKEKRKPATPSRLVSHLVGERQKSARADGHALPLLNISTDIESGVALMGIDISSAPVPQRRYSAELCWLGSSGLDFKLIFGQQGVLDSGPLDSALIVRMNPSAAEDFIRAVDKLSNPSLVEIAEKNALGTEQLAVVTEAPKQTAAMVANLVAVGVAGHETCLDFYHASAFAMRKAAQSSSLEVEPVVRVDLRTTSFIPLMNELKRIVESRKITVREA